MGDTYSRFIKQLFPVAASPQVTTLIRLLGFPASISFRGLAVVARGGSEGRGACERERRGDTAKHKPRAPSNVQWRHDVVADVSDGPRWSTVRDSVFRNVSPLSSNKHSTTELKKIRSAIH